MKLNHTITILILAIFSFQLYSQKSYMIYDGKFEDGTAKYQYFENDDYERIYEGDFIFKSKNKSIVGEFKNNLRNGKWIINIEEEFRNTSTKKNIIVHYDNGNLKGEINFTEEITNNNTKAKSIKIRKAYIADNKFKGDLMYVSKNSRVNDTLIIKINNNGFIEGDYNFYFKEYGENFKSILSYSNGILKKMIIIKSSTGDIIHKKDISEYVAIFNDKFRQDSVEVTIKNYIFSKAIFSLSTSGRFNFLHDNYTTKSTFSIKDLVDNEKFSNDVNLKELASIGTIYSNSNLIGKLIFWLDIASGDYYDFNRGVDFTLTYPVVDFYRITNNGISYSIY